MKIIHISDLHYDKNHFPLSVLVKDIDNFVEQNDEVILALTGDLVNQANIEDYSIINQDLIKKLTNKYSKINLQYVLGNHDIFIKKEKIIFPEIDGVQLNKKFSFETYLEDSFKYSILCINPVAHEDLLLGGEAYGKLAIPPESYDFLKEKYINAIHGCSLNVVLIHHPFTWFSSKYQSQILEACNKANAVVLCGHQHYAKTLIDDDYLDYSKWIFSGSLKNNFKETIYSWITIDKKTLAIEVYRRVMTKQNQNHVFMFYDSKPKII